MPFSAVCRRLTYLASEFPRYVRHQGQNFRSKYQVDVPICSMWTLLQPHSARCTDRAAISYQKNHVAAGKNRRQMGKGTKKYQISPGNRMTKRQKRCRQASRDSSPPNINLGVEIRHDGGLSILQYFSTTKYTTFVKVLGLLPWT